MQRIADLVHIPTRADLAQMQEFRGLLLDPFGNPKVWRNRYECSTGHAMESWVKAASEIERCACPICGVETSSQSFWIGPESQYLIDLWSDLSPSTSKGDRQ